MRQIADAGFRPVQRDSLYRVIAEPDVAAMLAARPVDGGGAGQVLTTVA